MDSLTALQGFGLTLPTPAYLAGAIVFGLIGWAAYRHGKKSDRPRTKWLGVGLMLYPYMVSQTWLLFVVGVVLCIGVALDRG
jgi:hypothetical protein